MYLMIQSLCNTNKRLFSHLCNFRYNKVVITYSTYSFGVLTSLLLDILIEAFYILKCVVKSEL